MISNCVLHKITAEISNKRSCYQLTAESIDVTPRKYIIELSSSRSLCLYGQTLEKDSIVHDGRAYPAFLKRFSVLAELGTCAGIAAEPSLNQARTRETQAARQKIRGLE